MTTKTTIGTDSLGRSHAYKVPSKAATERAKAHLRMAVVLETEYDRKDVTAPQSYLTVIAQEVDRQRRMVNHYQYVYGPNAAV